jgi:RNA polymerase sigma-70 factor, ECF subfamily
MDPKRINEVHGLFLRHSGVLRGFILGMLPQRDEAEDVFQEVFLTVAQKAEAFTPGTDFLAWARAIARNKVLEAYRKRKTQAPLGPAAFDAVAASAPELDDTWDLRRQAIAECMEQVTDRARQIIDLRYAQNSTPPEIARRMSSTASVVSSSLARTRQFLRDCARRRMKAQA